MPYREADRYAGSASGCAGNVIHEASSVSFADVIRKR
jgi:hypothetical protein